MSPVLAGALIWLGIIGTAVVAVAVPVLVGFMLYEIFKTEESGVVATAHTPFRIAVQRGVARGFVLAGGIFWSLASFAGLYSFRQSGLVSALLAALIPLAGCIVTLVVGWYFERVVAALLVVASFVVVAWGVVYQFEMGVWVLMTLALIGPMATAAVLFWLARRDQEAYEMAFSYRPELSFFFSARSSLVPAAA
jgi:hypothetical protein